MAEPGAHGRAVSYNYRHVALKVGEPLDLRAFLNDSNGVSAMQYVRRVTYAMLRRLERERAWSAQPRSRPTACVTRSCVAPSCARYLDGG